MEKLREALESFKKEYLAHAETVALCHYQNMVDALVAGGWDLEKVAPYPSANMSRASFRQAHARYHQFRSFFKSVEGSRKMYEPNIVVEVPGAKERLVASYLADAEDSIESYLVKMSKKIGKEILEARYEGNLWQSSILHITTPEGVEKWKTQCIVNVSCLGTFFNQWPSRKIQS